MLLYHVNDFTATHMQEDKCEKILNVQNMSIVLIQENNSSGISSSTKPIVIQKKLNLNCV